MDIQRTNVLGIGISSINMDETVSVLLNARQNGVTGYVCVTGVHGVIESQRDPELKQIHNRSFLTVPDGMPTVWMGREQGFVHMGRVYGPDLMLEVCRQTAALNQALGAGHEALGDEGQALGARDEALGTRHEALGNEGRALGTGHEALGARTQKPVTHNSPANCDSNYHYPSQDETGGLDVGNSIPNAQRPTPSAQKPMAKSKNDSSYLYPSQDETGGLDVGNSIPNAQRPMPSAKKIFTHFLYGSTPETLSKLKANLEAKFPGLQIVGTYAPPFRPLNEEEELELQRIVSACKPDFFWVGLSTPKQERFMASHDPRALGAGRWALDSGEVLKEETRFHKDNASAEYPDSQVPSPAPNAQCPMPLDCGIMLGVGAAFPIHAGLQKDAPEWVKNSGLQWLHRLCQEPKRLWRRYLDIVPTFLWLAFLQLLGIKKYSIEDDGR